MPSDPSQFAESPAGVSSTNEQTVLLLEKENCSKPLLIAFRGQDSLSYAAALVDGVGTGWHGQSVSNALYKRLTVPLSLK
jgi:hypothetical protein